MTRSVHQLVHTLSYGDAISGEVLALQRAFRKQGISSEIYAINVHQRYLNSAKLIKEFSEDGGAVILHYSLGSPLNEIYRGLKKSTRVLIHHNLTPAKWFNGVNPRIVRDLEVGIRELPELCKISDRLIADSEFNADELRAFGHKAQVLNLPIDPEKWSISSNQGIASIVKSEPGIHLLHVGRLAPNKCIEDIIKTFYFLNRFVEPNSRLWLVGIDIDTELYSFALKRLVHELDLQNVINFTGGLADSEVKALYENASAYLCMSEHEGFCLPVVEAMHFGLPVIAFNSSALPDTVKGGGILVSEKRHAEIAELIGQVVRDGSLREKLILAGKQRASELSLQKFEEQVSSLFR